MASRDRRPMVLARLGGWLLAILLAPAASARQEAPERPNVLFVVVDDLSDHVLHDAFPELRTPALDRLDASAVRFERAYCPAPACVPSRAAFLSGIAPHRTGAYFNGTSPWRASPLLAACESLPECFRRGGSLTFGAGKIFHARLGKEREEATWDNDRSKGGFGPYPDPSRWIFGNRSMAWEAWSGPDSDFPDVVNTDTAVEVLGSRHERPFFLAVGLWRPHAPFTAPRRFFELYSGDGPGRPPGFREDDLADVPAAGRALADALGSFRGLRLAGEAVWMDFLRAYLAATTFADWNLGRILDALESGPHARDTLVVVFSDNGYHTGEKGHWGKNTLWEAAAHTPLWIRRPGEDRGGARVRTPVSLLDLYPTLVELCDLEAPPQELDGRSLVPLLEGREEERAALTTYGEGTGSVRDRRWRLIRYADGSEELYDHERDPFELENRIADESLAPVAARLRAHLPDTWAPSLERSEKSEDKAADH